MKENLASNLRNSAALCLSILLVAALLWSNAAQNVSPQVGVTPPAQSYAQKGKSQVGSARRDPKLLEAALATLREALRLDPNDPVALFGMGWALQEQGKDLESLGHYERAIHESRTIIGLSRYNASFVAERRGDIALAVSQLKEAVAALPDFKEAGDRLAKLEGSRAAQ